MTGNDNQNDGRRNPWAQKPQSGNPWGQNQQNGNGGPSGPDLDDMLRRARAMAGQLGKPDGEGRMVAFALAALAIVWLGSGIYRVEPGENAVIQRFGAIERTQGQPGLGYRLPWPVESVTKLNVMLDRRTTVGFIDSGIGGTAKQDISEESLMLTADANIVDIDVVVLWNIGEAEKYLFSVRNPDQTVKRVAESAIREAVGQTKLQSIITQGRDDVAIRIQKSMQGILDSYKSGIAVKQVLIQEATVHPDVLEAYNDVAASRQDAERYQNEAMIYRNDIIPKARGQAIKMLQDAQAYKQDVTARATGDASRFSAMLEAYRSGKDVTRDRLYIETMERVLSTASSVIVDQKDGAQGVVPVMQLQPRTPAPTAPVVEITPAAR